MLNPKELMLGNWVYESEKSKFPMRVVNIDKDMVYLDFEGNEGDWFDGRMEDICPIPLTEEIIDETNAFVFKESGISGKTYMLKGMRYFVLSFIDDCFECELAGSTCIVKYVHQLQNILTIAGIEIEFKI